MLSHIFFFNQKPSVIYRVTVTDSNLLSSEDGYRGNRPRRNSPIIGAQKPKGITQFGSNPPPTALCATPKKSHIHTHTQPPNARSCVGSAEMVTRCLRNALSFQSSACTMLQSAAGPARFVQRAASGLRTRRVARPPPCCNSQDGSGARSRCGFGHAVQQSPCHVAAARVLQAAQPDAALASLAGFGGGCRQLACSDDLPLSHLQRAARGARHHRLPPQPCRACRCVHGLRGASVDFSISGDADLDADGLGACGARLLDAALAGDSPALCNVVYFCECCHRALPQLLKILNNEMKSPARWK